MRHRSEFESVDRGIYHSIADACLTKIRQGEHTAGDCEIVIRHATQHLPLGIDRNNRIQAAREAYDSLPETAAG